MIRKKSKGYFSISAVAKMFAVHQQTIRMYEKEGLISPKRSEGNTRLFTEEDLKRLEEVVYLTHTMGINLAGVEMILKLKKHIKKMQKEMNSLFKQANNELDREASNAKKIIEDSVTTLLGSNKKILNKNVLPDTAPSDSTISDTTIEGKKIRGKKGVLDIKPIMNRNSSMKSDRDKNN